MKRKLKVDKMLISALDMGVLAWMPLESRVMGSAFQKTETPSAWKTSRSISDRHLLDPEKEVY
jgi:hypothetical protein